MAEFSASRLSRSSGQRAFGGDAVGYHAGRIGYPDELFDTLFEQTGPSPRILEIGAGTGLATQSLLARNPAELVLVESDPHLIDYLRTQFSDQRLSFVNANFPEPSLKGAFDLIVCAAAFHWMEPDVALPRVHHLLRPGGVWAMWWNAYRNPSYGDPLAQAITQKLSGVALPPSEGLDGHYSLDEDLHRRALERAQFGDIQHRVWRRDRQLTADEARQLYASYSYVRALPQPQRDKLLNDIANIVDNDFDGLAPNTVLTAIYSGVAYPLD